jgi:hypothetical protein
MLAIICSNFFVYGNTKADFFPLMTFLKEKKTMGRGTFRGAGRDENLKINFM